MVESLDQLPLVSIVTPCLNPGHRLQRCIDSVRAQTYPNIEHIVIDGGSTDGTVELLRATEQTKWVSEPDTGQTSAINKGFRLAAGEILSWLNADDQLTPASIETALSALFLEEAGWAYGKVIVVERGRTRIRKPSYRPSRDLFDLGKGGVIFQPGTVIKKEALNLVGELDETFNLAMDFDLWLRLIGAGVPFACVPAPLAIFEIHPDSKTGRLGLSEFFLEEARALSKAKRSDLADLARGRAAAHRAVEAGLIPSARLRQELRRFLESKEDGDHKVVRRIKAAALTEAALFEMNTSLRGVRHLLALDPWLVRETRLRIFSAVGQTVKSPVHFLQQRRS